jgi:hypothetical protein
MTTILNFLKSTLRTNGARFFSTRPTQQVSIDQLFNAKSSSHISVKASDSYKVNPTPRQEVSSAKIKEQLTKLESEHQIWICGGDHYDKMSKAVDAFIQQQKNPKKD